MKEVIGDRFYVIFVDIGQLICLFLFFDYMLSIYDRFDVFE